MIEGSKSEPSLTLNLTGSDVSTFITMMKGVRDGESPKYYLEDFARQILDELGENSYDREY